MKTLFTVAVFATMLLEPPRAAAKNDSPSARYEFRASGGWIGFPDEQIIHHSLVGASLRVSLTRRLKIEPELTFMVGPGSDRDVNLGSVISFEFDRWDRAKPYVLGSAGWLWHRERFVTGSYWSGDYIVSGGMGVRTQINRRWSLSPEFRLGWWPHMQFRLGVGYKF